MHAKIPCVLYISNYKQMKTFFKIILLVWALTVCIGEPSQVNTPDETLVKASLTQKITHLCEDKPTSRGSQKA